MLLAVLTFVLPPPRADQPFLPAPEWAALRGSASGAAPYENLRFLTGLHRVPATGPFDTAADFVLRKAKEYGLADAHAEQFVADGETNYGLMRSYLGWQVESATLWQLGSQSTLLADWATDPIRLARLECHHKAAYLNHIVTSHWAESRAPVFGLPKHPAAYYRLTLLTRRVSISR